MYHAARTQFEQRGVRIARSLVGNYVTSLDMAGCSVTRLAARRRERRLVGRAGPYGGLALGALRASAPISDAPDGAALSGIGGVETAAADRPMPPIGLRHLRAASVTGCRRIPEVARATSWPTTNSASRPTLRKRPDPHVHSQGNPST